jgi:hypothetical protein
VVLISSWPSRTKSPIHWSSNSEHRDGAVRPRSVQSIRRHPDVAHCSCCLDDGTEAAKVSCPWQIGAGLSSTTHHSCGARKRFPTSLPSTDRILSRTTSLYRHKTSLSMMLCKKIPKPADCDIVHMSVHLNKLLNTACP